MSQMKDLAELKKAFMKLELNKGISQIIRNS